MGLSGPDLVISDIASGGHNDSLTILRSGANIRVFDPHSDLTAGSGATQIDTHTVEIPQTSVTGSLQIATGAGNDTLTVDFSGGNPIPAGGLNFDGGAGGNDALTVTGYSLTTADGVADVSVIHTGNDSGTIVLAGLGTITFDEIEPLTLGGTAADLEITLPAGADSITLGDDGVVRGDDGGSPDPNGNTANTGALYDAFSPTRSSSPSSPIRPTRCGSSAAVPPTI